MNPELDEFDQLFDQALAAYTPAEARPYLEQRLQAALSAASEARIRRPRWLLLLPLAMAVLLIGVGAMLYFPNHAAETIRAGGTQSPGPVRSVNRQNKPAPMADNTPGKTATRGGVGASGERRARLLAPSARPALTEQERQLFRLVSLQPGAAQSILRLQADRDLPLQVRAIQDKPIQIERIRWSAIPVQPLEIPPFAMATSQPPTQPSSF